MTNATILGCLSIGQKSTRMSGNFGLKLNRSVQSNRKSFEKIGPPLDVHGPLSSVGPAWSRWNVPFDHSDPFPIPVPRCSAFSMYSLEENIRHCSFYGLLTTIYRCNSSSCNRSVAALQAKCTFWVLTLWLPTTHRRLVMVVLFVPLVTSILMSPDILSKQIVEIG